MKTNEATNAVATLNVLAEQYITTTVTRGLLIA